jgi:hypothetical protein
MRVFGYSTLPLSLADLRAHTKRRLVEGRAMLATTVRRPHARPGIAYVWVRTATVDPLKRRAAGQGRDSAVRTMIASGSPGIRWFRKAAAGETPDFSDARDMRGFFDRGSPVIALDVALTTAECREVAAHETRHWAGGDEPTSRAFGEQYVDEPVDLWSRR